MSEKLIMIETQITRKWKTRICSKYWWPWKECK